MRYVQVSKGIAGFLVGSRFVTREDGPFAVEDDARARSLIDAGLVEGCLPPSALAPEDAHSALHPGQASSAKAVRKR